MDSPAQKGQELLSPAGQRLMKDWAKELHVTRRSLAAPPPEKQIGFRRLMATSEPLHFPWKTVPNVPEPSSRISSRSAPLMVCTRGEEAVRKRGFYGEDARPS